MCSLHACLVLIISVGMDPAVHNITSVLALKVMNQFQIERIKLIVIVL